jgi:hypothetical protein
METGVLKLIDPGSSSWSNRYFERKQRDEMWVPIDAVMKRSSEADGPPR